MSAKVIPTKLPLLYRSVELERAGMDEEKRTVAVRFSTESEVHRWFGREILDHGKSSIRMDRVKNGAAVLMEHDTRQRVGITESGEIKDKCGCAVVRFARTPRGDEAMAEVKDGTLKFLSVGYRVHKYDMEKPGTDEEEAVYRATDWEPYEISFTGIPADTGAQVTRSGSADELPVEIQNRHIMKPHINLDKDPSDKTGGDTGPAILDAKNSEKNRAKDILACAHRFRTKVPKSMEQAQEALEKDWGADKFNRWILDEIEKGPEVKPEVASQDASRTEHDSPGTQIVKSEKYLSLLRAGAFRKGSRISFEVDISKRATLTTSVPSLTKYERPPGVVMLGQQPLLVAQLFAQGTTENTTIRFLREDTFTNAATALAEEGTYQEQSWDMSEQDAPVRKCGVLSRATDEILADSAAIAAYFDARTAFAVASLQDSHLVDGSGSSNQITGVLNTSGIQTESVAASATPIDAILKAKTKVRSVGFYEPDAILMNPTDWQSVALTKDSNGQYLLGGPGYGPYGQGQYSNVMRLWGLPVIETTAIDQGTALVGAFLMGAQLWSRAGLTVEMSNSDASDFANGRIAIRASLRHALSVYRPTAFCTVTGIPA